ncbi:MAG: prepilin-type N-terminal cleavage/methylation domain-containing protein [Gemmatimonadales bacterium]|nr:prepilin-type N-terminal cleavage/methylation domain-containing protein [Gemmatimonadales bacterium]
MRHVTARRGFTLIELLLSMLLLGVVTAGIYRVLVSNQRTYHAQTQRIRLQQNIRAAGNIIPAELREVAASENDIYAIAATEIRIRAMRQFGVMCLEPVLGVGLADLPITLFRDLSSGPALAAGDSLLLYYEGDEGTRLDDQWWRAQIRSVVGNALCPDGISQGTAYRVNLAPATATMLNRPGAIPRGGPVRGFQAVRYSLYQEPSDNLWYLGLEVPIGGTIEPIVGPLSGSTGLTLFYFDRNGVTTAVADSVALVEIRVRGRTPAAVHRPTGGGLIIPVDSLMTRAAVRNNRRF